MFANIGKITLNEDRMDCGGTTDSLKFKKPRNQTLHILVKYGISFN